MFTTTNDGKNIISTNYWDSDHAKAGYMYISINAGCMRLLVPESKKSDLAEMATGNKIAIERGKWREQNNRDAILITFDDGSNLPYIIFVVAEQCDRLLSEDKCKIDFAIWTEEGLFKEWTNAEYKRVDYL